MIHQQEHDLYTLNTMRLHAVTTDYYEPESIAELTELLAKLKSEDRKYNILGGGSNIIMPPHIETVIALRSVCNDIKIDGQTAEVGASVKMQYLIREAQAQNLGGIEYLFSLPCQVGGAIAMNAGRGKSHGGSIADVVETVTCVDAESGRLITLKKQECGFTYRHSQLQDRGLIIVKAQLRLIPRKASEVEELIKERMELQRTHLDATRPSCGSVFCKCNQRIMRLLRGVHHGGATYSKKTKNWISNTGDATYDDIIFLIRIAKLLHQLLFQKCKTEIKIWKP